MQTDDSLMELLIALGLTVGFFAVGVWLVHKLWSDAGAILKAGDARAHRVGWARTEFSVGVMRTIPSFVAIFGLGCLICGVLVAEQMFPALQTGDAPRWIRMALGVLGAPIAVWPFWVYVLAFHARPSWMVPPAYRRERDR